jgi:hypothetical protein
MRIAGEDIRKIRRRIKLKMMMMSWYNSVMILLKEHNI